MAFYATFGTGRPYAGHYVKVETDDEEEAREVMFSAHGDKWAFLYNEEEGIEQVQKWDLKLLAVLRKNEFGNFKPISS